MRWNTCNEVSIPRRKAQNVVNFVDPKNEEEVSIPRRKAQNWPLSAGPVPLVVFPSLVGRLKTYSRERGVPLTMSFPSLVGRLKTNRHEDISHVAIAFPSLVGRLKTTTRESILEGRTMFPSLVGRLKTGRDIHHTRFSVGWPDQERLRLSRCVLRRTCCRHRIRESCLAASISRVLHATGGGRRQTSKAAPGGPTLCAFPEQSHANTHKTENFRETSPHFRSTRFRKRRKRKRRTGTTGATRTTGATKQRRRPSRASSGVTNSATKTIIGNTTARTTGTTGAWERIPDSALRGRSVRETDPRFPAPGRGFPG